MQDDTVKETGQPADPAPMARVGDEKQPVGSIIRQVRKAKGLSLAELARSADVSVGMLSQVERGLANPSLRLLTSIRSALGLTASELFSSTQPHSARDPAFVRRFAERSILDLGYLTKELLSANVPNRLHFMILNVPPSSTSGDQPLKYPAEKAGLVLEGQLLLRVGEEESRLFEGDSFLFDGSISHSFINNGETLARVLWIIGSIAVERHF